MGKRSKTPRYFIAFLYCEISGDGYLAELLFIRNSFVTRGKDKDNNQCGS
jgi:hypothetical protein